MRRDRRQDAEMDRLLRRSLGRVAGGTVGACPPPDELGAYLERSLSSDEARALERHVADCDRCQQVLATIALMPDDSGGTIAATGWWSSRAWRRWLVPAAAVATALILYVALKPQLAPQPGVTEPLEPSTVIARQLPSTPAPALTAPAPTALPSAPAPRRLSPGPPASSGKGAAPAAEAASPVAVPAGAGLPTAAAPAPGAPARAALPPTGATAVAPAPPSARPEAPLALRASARADRATAKEEAPAKQVQPDANQGRAVTTIVADAADKPAAPPTKVATKAAPAPSVGGAMMEAVTVVEPGRAADKRQAAVPVVLLTAGSTRWRLEPRGGISRSTDSGATWQVQRPAGGTVLLAGAAQSATVCWAVGAAGTVLLTTDGSRWELRPFPERIDLVAVTADDGDGIRATVTARDGRRFATTDGGASWILR